MARTLFFAGILAVLGCSQGGSKMEALDETLRVYHIHVSAGDVDRASAYVAGKAQEVFGDLYDPEHAPRVEELQVVSVTQDASVPDGKRVYAIIAAQVRKTDSLVIKPVRWKETWEQTEAGGWEMTDVEVVPAGRNPGGARPEDVR